MKAPKTGERLNQAFPPPPEGTLLCSIYTRSVLTAFVVRPEVVFDAEEAKKIDKYESGGDLQVLRHAPVGKLYRPVVVASITFNQPMVPVASVADLKERKSSPNLCLPSDINSS